MKRVLYLGTKLPETSEEKVFFHCPLIEVKCRSFVSLQKPFLSFKRATHVIFTSRYAVQFTMEALRFFWGEEHLLEKKKVIVIGGGTGETLQSYGVKAHYQANPSTQEGVILLLGSLDLTNSFVFYPRSSIARPLIIRYLKKYKWRFLACDLYDTYKRSCLEIPPLEGFEEIHFTSPSVVEAFFKETKEIPPGISLVAIGPITQAALERVNRQEKTPLLAMIFPEFMDRFLGV